MKENLARLIELQAVDSELMEIEELKGDLPAQVERLEQDLETLKGAITEKKDRLREIEIEAHGSQGKLDDSREHLKKYQDQLVVVSTNRAYDALMTEMDVARQIIEESEYHLLELQEERSRLDDELKAAKLEAGEKKKRIGVQKTTLAETIAESEERAKTLEKERLKLLAKIAPNYYRSYERIRKARDGRAVVSLTRGSCGACYNTIPPQRQSEIKAMDRIVTCDNCGVILFWDQE